MSCKINTILLTDCCVIESATESLAEQPATATAGKATQQAATGPVLPTGARSSSSQETCTAQSMRMATALS